MINFESYDNEIEKNQVVANKKKSKIDAYKNKIKGIYNYFADIITTQIYFTPTKIWTTDK